MADWRWEAKGLCKRLGVGGGVSGGHDAIGWELALIHPIPDVNHCEAAGGRKRSTTRPLLDRQRVGRF